PPPPPSVAKVEKKKIKERVQPVPQAEVVTEETKSSGAEGGVEGSQEGGVMGGVVGSPAPAPAAPPPPPPQISEADRRKLLLEYLHDKVQPALLRNFTYPDDAQRENVEGIVTVRLTIAKGGQLRGAQVAGACPNEILCRAALALARKSSPFPDYPEILGPFVQVDVRIEFRLE